MRAITYRRVSTREQADTGHGLDAQATALDATIRAKGWEHVADFADVHTGKTTSGRKHLQDALGMLERGEADALVCTKVDRLARSTIDFGRILRRANAQGWQLVVTDLAVDTSTPTGKMIANVVAALAEWEADTIADRTKVALAEVRKKGTRLGRPTSIPERVRERIVTMRGDHTLQQIADALNADGVPTARGGAKWHVSTVRYVVRSAA